MKGWRWQFSAFALVGGLATAVQYLLMALLIDALGWPAVPASGLSYAISAALNYLLNRRYVFRSRVSHGVAGPRFLLIVLIGLALNMGLLYIGVEMLDLHWLLAQLFTTALVMLNNFLLAKFWAFGRGGLTTEGRS
ncbi:GtrA family protein [Roseateles sp. DAIF2]|uniref:GtrA family protein n=1 Tax=Roseateles sp. DAIF2 TaxID=2714952 RepID=UPI0018A28BD5|nr:GtrA family protein [Roseateles sp. DAIF2]QPF73701.1 GtrA family protein [Roseateles sp. DAIF2]